MLLQLRPQMIAVYLAHDEVLTVIHCRKPLEILEAAAGEDHLLFRRLLGFIC